MNILLVNDDGYGSKGIELVKSKLSKYGTVYVAAPAEHQSGASMKFSIFKGFKVNRYSEHDYAIDGTPVDCVLVAVQILPVKFDLVVSGCNDGLNISYDTCYSGTIGAALEAMMHHSTPSIALSTDFNAFEIVEKELESVLDLVIGKKLYNSKYCLNINWPKKHYKESKGIKITRQIFKDDDYYTWMEDGLLHTDRHEHLDHVKDVESDVWAVNNGYISITPLKPTYFHEEDLIELKKHYSEL